jgi:hypothetical protein
MDVSPQSVRMWTGKESKELAAMEAKRQRAKLNPKAVAKAVGTITTN